MGHDSLIVAVGGRRLESGGAAIERSVERHRLGTVSEALSLRPQADTETAKLGEQDGEWGLGFGIKRHDAPLTRSTR